MNEVWREVEGTGYQVSSLGRMIGRRGKILHPTRLPSGYYTVSIDGSRTYVHRLVAEAFLGRPEGKQVDHIDGNKDNNAVTNLQWVSHQENCRRREVLGLVGIGRSRRCPVRMVTDELVREFPSQQTAARAIGKNQSAISFAIKHGTRVAGARWERVE